jgi:excisionase family DNA binding protein
VSERYLTAAELGELLGFSAGTVVDWAERKEIPAFKLGGRLRFRESEVLVWLEERRTGNGGGRSANHATPPPEGVVYGLPTTHEQEDEHGS